MAGEENKARGAGDKVKGKVQEAVGDLKGDDSMKDEGQGNKAKGTAKEGAGRVEDAVDSLKH